MPTAGFKQPPEVLPDISIIAYKEAPMMPALIISSMLPKRYFIVSMSFIKMNVTIVSTKVI